MATFGGNPAMSALDGTEIIPGKQGSTDGRTTAQAIADLARGSYGANIASATTTNLSSGGNTRHITGTVTITGLGTVAAGVEREVIFDGILILTHNATSLILLTGANITTAAGDCARFVSEGSGNWRMIGYERTSGSSLAPGGVGPYDIIVALGDETTAIATGTAMVTIRAPRAMTLTKVKASLSTASSSGLPTFNVKKNGTSIFSTTLTIDATEKTSETAATAAVLSTTAIAADDELTFDISTAGTGATGAKIVLVGTA